MALITGVSVGPLTNKRTAPMQDINHGGGCVGQGQGVYKLHTFCSILPKTALKKLKPILHILQHDILTRF